MRSLDSFKQLYWRIFAKNPSKDLFLSSYCVLCGDFCTSDHDLICSPCRADLPTINNPCQVCSTPLSPNILAKTCGSCLHLPPFYQNSIIPLEYIFPNNLFIKHLKYNQKLIYSEILAKSLLNKIKQKKSPLPECIIPVPLHPRRLIKRGYNQSELIAKLIAQNLEITVDIKTCRRIKNTAQQTGFTNKERKKNVYNAFSVCKNFPYKHIAILDDVVTTGSTINELAKALHQAGAKTIEVWACARTSLDHKDS